MRYIPLVAQRGAKIIAGCQRELISLIKNVNCVSQAVLFGEESPKFDVYCPLGRLPHIFNTTLETIPVDTPYINVDQYLLNKWERRIEKDHNGLKIGLVWAVENSPKKRSVMLDKFSPLFKLDNIAFYSLQKGAASNETNNPSIGIRIINYMNEIEDFMDTAALIEIIGR